MEKLCNAASVETGITMIVYVSTTGDDDYICRMCTDDLLHIDSGTGSNDNEIELNNESIGNPVSGNHDMSLIEPEDESESTQENESIKKKKDVIDKTYILDLENQIKY